MIGVDPVTTVAFRVAIVGSGPSGFYAAEALLRSGAPVTVDMFERLPVPFGLVRFGVAPDHPKLKLVTGVFDRIAASPGFDFFGGITVGRDVTVDELTEAYDAVVLATGADVDRPLAVPGEFLPGCWRAGDFVAWYNGHPDSRDRKFDLGSEVAVVVGHGNVALDVARILAKSVDELCRTDIARHALAVLADSRVREIHVVGRGTPARTKFSAKELREFLDLAECTVSIESSDLAPDALTPTAFADAEAAEKFSLFRQFSQQIPTKRRRCIFRFDLAPIAIQGWSRVESIAFQRPSGVTDEIACGIAVSSVGRRTAPLDGVPYDERSGVHANVDGRVLDGASHVEGLYVCGWSKRGPNGTIGSNRSCGVATASAVLADLEARRRPLSSDSDALLARLRGRVPRIVSYRDWAAVDAAEKEAGALIGKPREKFVSIPDILAAIGA